jgi:acetyl esterase/lipase
MTRELGIIATALFLIARLAAPSVAQRQDEIPLWPNGAPGARGTAPADIPSITPYVSPTAPEGGATVVILPGGGYSSLSPREGNDFALWFSQQGVSTFVLKYRLGSAGYHNPSMLQDAARAVRYVRANAAKFKIDPNRIVIMGSSAGGHLASTLMTHFDAGKPDNPDPIEKQSSRPDFGVLCYPVITMGELTHAGSKRGFLGDNPTPEDIKEFSNELKVTPQTPPCFIWHTLTDTTVPVENTIEFAAALRKNKVPFDLHLYQSGGHGLGLGDAAPPFAKALPWTTNLLLWMNTNRLLPPGNTAPALPGRGGGRGAATRGPGRG